MQQIDSVPSIMISPSSPTQEAHSPVRARREGQRRRGSTYSDEEDEREVEREEEGERREEDENEPAPQPIARHAGGKGAKEKTGQSHLSLGGARDEC